MAYSQNGFKAADYRLMARYTVPGSKVWVVIRKGDVSVVLLELMRRFNKDVQPLRQIDIGGYNPRSVIGGRSLSNHASGTAVDLRWRDHPLGVRNTFTDKQEREIRKILSYMDGVVRWGGNYQGRKDEMHFEINASLARVSDLADKIRHDKLQPSSRPVPPVTMPRVLHKGVTNNEEVKYLQRNMNDIFPAYRSTPLTVDGDYGPKTESAVKEFQLRTGLKVDGMVGVKTRAMLKRYHVLP